MDRINLILRRMRFGFASNLDIRIIYVTVCYMGTTTTLTLCGVPLAQ